MLYMNDIDFLKMKCDWVWRETLALHKRAPETRIASSLSPIEIFVALYYGGVLQHYPDEPYHNDRDRCIISKGHGSICMYPILADCGYFSFDELQKICKRGSFLGGIPDPIIPGYETVNGSLGHGLGVATGIALALQRSHNPRNVFVICGDGEMHEGANWEALMFASHHKLDNLNLIIDNNKISMLGYTDNILSHQGLAHRLQAFGWDVCEVDGHNYDDVHNSLHKLKVKRQKQPKAFIAHTIKGRGVPDLANEPLSHIINPKITIIDELLA